MALPSHHDLKISEWTWFANEGTMGSTLWLVYCWTEACMQDAMEKIVFPNVYANEWMIPTITGLRSWDWNKISKKSQKYLEKITHSRQSKPTSQKIHEMKNQVLKKYFAISKLYNDFWTHKFFISAWSKELWIKKEQTFLWTIGPFKSHQSYQVTLKSCLQCL